MSRIAGGYQENLSCTSLYVACSCTFLTANMVLRTFYFSLNTFLQVTVCTRFETEFTKIRESTLVGGNYTLVGF